MTPTDPETPQTAAGRDFAADIGKLIGVRTARKTVSVIEAEARAARDAEVRALVEAEKARYHELTWAYDRIFDDILAILSDTPEKGDSD